MALFIDHLVTMSNELNALVAELQGNAASVLVPPAAPKKGRGRPKADKADLDAAKESGTAAAARIAVA
jgi:hypothetical protein